MCGKDVEPDGIRFIRWIEEYHLAHAFLGDMAKDLVNEVAVRIEDGQALAIPNILHDHVKEQRGFSAPGCPDKVQVPHALIGTERDLHRFPGMVILAQGKRIAERHGGSRFRPAFFTLQFRGAG